MKLPYAVTLGPGSSLTDLTGTWRTERPVYQTLTAPVRQRLPGRRGRADLALPRPRAAAPATRRPGARSWRSTRSRRSSAGSATTRARPPATAASLDEAVGINSVERFLGDRALEHGWTVAVTAPPTGRRVLVIGAGPAGLSAAYHLTLLGHDVVIRDSAPAAGGMMRYGIPRYRLPREVLDAEVDRVLALGRRARARHARHRPRATSARRAGTRSSWPSAPSSASGPTCPPPRRRTMVDAVSMLHGLEEGERPLLGRRVAVYGGGDTAIDAARTAKRLGASDAVVVYRRTRERMPAHDDEVDPGRGGGRRVPLALHHRPGRPGRAADRADGARRGRLPAAHRPHRAAGRGLRGPRAGPGHRPVAARASTAASASRTASSRPTASLATVGAGRLRRRRRRSTANGR